MLPSEIEQLIKLLKGRASVGCTLIENSPLSREEEIWCFKLLLQAITSLYIRTSKKTGLQYIPKRFAEAYSCEQNRVGLLIELYGKRKIEDATMESEWRQRKYFEVYRQKKSGTQKQTEVTTSK